MSSTPIASSTVLAHGAL
ncbi:hypothetical protein E2L06_16650 [Haloterrigena sp. H1]|nr:hypothetical protein E2L06_16650 [Haloterrigena sp. H1]